MRITTIGVIGAGALGRGIACTAAVSGYQVVLEDASVHALTEALGDIKQALIEASAIGKMGAERDDSVLARIATAHSVHDVCRRAHLIIEAVAEEMEMKLELFSIFDKFAKPGAILATSSRSLSITEMAEMTFCPENCIGLRFGEPVLTTNRLEIIRAPMTSDATVDTCVEFGRRIGKDVFLIREHEKPGRMHSR